MAQSILVPLSGNLADAQMRTEEVHSENPSTSWVTIQGNFDPSFSQIDDSGMDNPRIDLLPILEKDPEFCGRVGNKPSAITLMTLFQISSAVPNH
jgi:hypothetical protein